MTFNACTSKTFLFFFIFLFFSGKIFSQNNFQKIFSGNIFEKNISENISGKNFVAKKNYVRGEILFQLKKNFSKKNLENFVQNSGNAAPLFIRDIAPDQNIFVYTFDDTVENENDVLQKFRDNAMIETAQFNYLVEPRTTTPNDSLYNRQWYLKTIRAAQAWDNSTGGVTPCGDTIVVAVLDRGFDPYIKEFAPNLWKNKDEIPNNGIDDDGNGLIDDYVGYNFFSGNDDHTKVLQEIDPYHGNYCAGLIGAAGNNKIGITGVNWNVKLMILSGVTNEGVIISALSYAIKMRKLYNDTGGKKGAFIAATSMSLGLGDGNRPENHKLWCSMYDSLGQQGILNFVAATNSIGDINVVGDIPGLCSSDYLLTINSTDSLDKFVDGGYSPKYVAFSAPGLNIVTTSIANGYTTESGNSLAAPISAGATALLYAIKSNGANVCATAKTNPTKAALQIKNALTGGLDIVANLTGKSRTGGRLNLFNSVQQIITDVKEPTATENFLVYPNPATDDLTIILPNISVPEINLLMYDAAGRIVKTQILRANGTPTNISLQDVPAGFYSLLCVTDKVIYRQKLVIEK